MKKQTRHNTATECPCCGRAFPKVRLVTAVNPAELNDTDVYAYYKRTAPVEDVKFQLRLQSLSADVRTAYEQLLMVLEQQGGKATPATKREYLRLQQVQRETRAAFRYVAAGRSGWSRKSQAA